MERKRQILILLAALVVLVGGVYLIVKSVSDKEQGLATPQKPPSKTSSQNMFAQNQAEKNNTAEAIGRVELISEKNLTIEQSEQKIVVNITGATPVMITTINNAMTTGQMADILTGDAVEVTYEKETKNAKLIKLMRP